MSVAPGSLVPNYPALVLGLLMSLIASRGASTDLRSLSFKSLLARSGVVCRFHLAEVQERPERDEDVSSLESRFELTRALRGDCPAVASIHWSRQELLSLDQVGSDWILFLTKGSGKEPWQIVSPPHGAWKIETLQVLDWSQETIEVASPSPFANILELPDQVFYSSRFHKQYFPGLGIDFDARVIRADLFQMWLTKTAEVPTDIPGRLAAATSVSEMDRISDEAVKQRRILLEGLVRLLQSSAQQEQKARVCYILGQFRAEGAINALSESFFVTTGPAHDIERIPRFGSYPCIEALGYIGKPAEAKILELLKSTEDSSLRRDLLSALIYIERHHTPALLREELNSAKDAEAARLRDALREFGEKQ